MCVRGEMRHERAAARSAVGMVEPFAYADSAAGSTSAGLVSARGLSFAGIALAVELVGEMERASNAQPERSGLAARGVVRELSPSKLFVAPASPSHSD